MSRKKVRRKRRKQRKKRTGNRSEYHNMCGKKKTYRSKRSAKWAADKAQQERGAILHQYRCPYCKKWHNASED